MKRTLEKELMEDEEQVIAYAAADFDEPHSHFIELFRSRFPDQPVRGLALDLGCGPGDISFRFAEAFSECTIHAVDGSATMLSYGETRLVRRPDLVDRIWFIQGRLPAAELPAEQYDLIFSNSLLHHLPDSAVLWSVIRRYSKPGSVVFVMDLFRPESRESAAGMVGRYAEREPEVLRRDFFNSLLAAFTLDEISGQLKAYGLEYLSLEAVSDRHFTVSGIIR